MPLKRAKGAYAVSTLTLELPARNPRAVQPDHYKINGRPAFHLTTVLVTIFYPTDRKPQAVKSKRKPTSVAEKIKGSAADAAQHTSSDDTDSNAQQGSTSGTKAAKPPAPVHWLNTPRMRSLEGLLKFAGLPKWVALPVILPAYRAFHARLPYETNAPLSTRVPDLDGQHSRRQAATDKDAHFSPLIQLLRAQQREGKGVEGNNNKPVFPCAVFSHGLGGTRVTYSAYAAALASHGVVVAAIEHRDGTAPATTICSLVDKEGKQIRQPPADGDEARYWEESLIWLSMKDLDPDEKVNPKDFLTARRAQLVLRRAEFLEALSVLRRLNAGEGEQLEKECLRTHFAKKTVGPTPAKRDSSRKSVRQKQRDGILVEVGSQTSLNLKSWANRLDIDNAWALGHSFGAATVIEVMRCASTPAHLELDPDQLTTADRASRSHRPEEHSTLLHPTHAEVAEAQAFKHALVLDPWTEPLAERGRAQKLTRPLFVINSEAFTVWRKNFEPLRRLVEEASQNDRTGEGWLVTLSKTRHTDFSDYPFLLKTMIGSDVKASECNRVFAGLTILQIAARASTPKSAATTDVPVGGAQAQEGNGGGHTSVQADVLADSLAQATADANGSAAPAPASAPASASASASAADAPSAASFWAAVDALMNANGNDAYRAADRAKAQYAGCVQSGRLRAEWEGETEQSRLGRPLGAGGSGSGSAEASRRGKRRGAGDEAASLEYGNERPGVLVVHPLGTPGSCPRRLVGTGLNGAVTLEDAAAVR